MKHKVMKHLLCMALCCTLLSLCAGGMAEESIVSAPAWLSENPDAATVDEEGVVTAVGVGSTAIVVSFNGMSAQVPVFVNAPDTAGIPLDPTLEEAELNTDMPPQKIPAKSIVVHTPVTYLNEQVVENTTSQTLYGFPDDNAWNTMEGWKKEAEAAGITDLKEFLSESVTKTVTQTSTGPAGYETHSVTRTYQIRQKGSTNVARITREGKALARTNINYISLNDPITISRVNASPSGKGIVTAIAYTTSNKGSQTVQYITDGNALRLVGTKWKDITIDSTYNLPLYFQNGEVGDMLIHGGTVTFSNVNFTGVIEVRGAETIVIFDQCTFGPNALVRTTPRGLHNIYDGFGEDGKMSPLGF